MTQEVQSTPLYNIAAEQALLGALLINFDVWHDVRGLVVRDDFHDERHRLVWDVLGELYREGAAIDIQVVNDRMARRGAADFGLLMDLVNKSEFSAAAPSHAKTVADLAIRRRIVQSLSETAKAAYDLSLPATEAIEVARRKMNSVEANLPASDVRHISDAVRDFDEAMERGEAPARLYPTKSYDLNRILGGGLWSGRCVLIAGRAKEGKTLLVVGRIAEEVAECMPEGNAVFVVSQEMKERDLVVRSLSARGKLQEENLHMLNIKGGEDGYYKAIGELSALPIYISDRSKWSIEALRAQVHRLKVNNGVQVVIVDYLGLIANNPDLERARAQEHEQLGWKTEELKRMAKDLDVAVLAIHTMNASNSMSGGAAPEYKYDVSLLLYDDETYQSILPMMDRAQPQHNVRWLVEYQRRYGKRQAPAMLIVDDNYPLIRDGLVPSAQR